MSIDIFFCVIFLSTLTDGFGSDLLDRIEFPQYDPETLEKIKSNEELLENLFANTLQTFSNLEDPYILEPLNYNEGQIGVFLKNLIMVVEDASIITKAELLQQILKIELTVKNVFIDGILLSNVVSNQKATNFRFRSQNIVCYGTAGLLLNNDQLGSEWVLMDCLQKKFTSFKDIFTIMLKDGPHDGGINIAISLETGLLRSIETSLNSLTSLKLKEGLHQVPPTLKKLLYKGANTELARLETSDSNTFLDAAISVATYLIKLRHNDTVQLPDIKEAIPCSLLFVLRCDTGFIAKKGLARDVSTLQRVGNARITRRNVTVDFAGTLKFQKLDIYYEQYQASLFGIGPTGNLRIISEPVIVGIQLRLNFGNRRIYLTSFKLKTLGRTQVEVSGLGKLLGRVLRRITTCIIGIFNAQVSQVIEQRVASYTKEALKKNTIDNIMSGNINV